MATVGAGSKQGEGGLAWVCGGVVVHGMRMAMRPTSPVGRERGREGGSGSGQPWRDTERGRRRRRTRQPLGRERGWRGTHGTQGHWLEWREGPTVGEDQAACARWKNGGGSTRWWAGPQGRVRLGRGWEKVKGAAQKSLNSSLIPISGFSPLTPINPVKFK